MGAIFGIPGFSSIQEQMIEDAIRQQRIHEQFERAIGGRAVLDFIESNHVAFKLAELHLAEQHCFNKVAHDLPSWVAEQEELRKWAKHFDPSHGFIRDVTTLKLAGPAAGLEALKDEINLGHQYTTFAEAIRCAAEEHQSIAQQLVHDARGYTEMASIASRCTDVENTFAATIRNHPALSVSDAVRAAMAIESPWVRTGDPSRSFSGFAVLSDIGQSMAELDSNYADAAARLSSLVGTWAPPSGFAFWDHAQRLRAFMKSGIDESVFEIPTDSFAEVAEATGIVVPVPDAASKHSANPKEPQVVIAVGTSIHLAAHEHVRSSEILIRNRLCWSMAAVYGPNWPKHAIHGSVLAKLKARQAAPTQLTSSPSVLDYATFGELLSIVVRKDVWAATFANLPMTPEEFRICVGRLIEVRNAVDHGRELDPMEYVWAFAEATRLQRALGVQSSPVKFEQ